MRAIELLSLPTKHVQFHGIDVVLFGDELSLAVDRDGDLWAYYQRPNVTPKSEARGEWNISPGDQLPRLIGKVNLEGMDWKQTLVEYPFTLD